MVNILGQVRVAGDLLAKGTVCTASERGGDRAPRSGPFHSPQGEHSARQAVAGQRACKSEQAGYGGQARPEGKAEMADANSHSLATP